MWHAVSVENFTVPMDCKMQAAVFSLIFYTVCAEEFAPLYLRVQKVSFLLFETDACSLFEARKS
jgi:hypothetical protein